MTSLNNQNQSIISSDEIAFTSAFIEGVLTACCLSEKSSAWRNILLDSKQSTDVQLEDTEHLEEEIERIYHQLSDMELSYELPVDDSLPLNDQMRELRDWASGLWVGIEATKLDKKITDKDNLEFMEDIKQIVATPLAQEVEESGEDFQDLFEIQEYCKVAITHLFLTAIHMRNIN